MPIPRTLIEKHRSLREWAILTSWVGSIAHGTFVPSNQAESIDDKDVMAVCVPTLDYYFGLRELASRGTEIIKQDEWDITVYEARKFIRLLAQGNPNVLCVLWGEPAQYLTITRAGQLLLDERDTFVGKHVYRSFIGYAHGQLHRMTHVAYEGYMGEKRKTLVDRFGYDTKNASHLIRLLRMGIEFLCDGRLYVKREDGPELLAIKRGEWPMQRVLDEADRLFSRAMEAFMRSPLAAECNMGKVNNLAVRVVQTALEEKMCGMSCEPTS